MKRYIQYTVNVCLILALLLCTSCEKETLVTTLSDKNTVTLNLRVGDLKSRTIEDDENLNENLINTLNIFLYPTGSTTPIHEYFDRLTDNTTSNVTLAAKASELFPDGATECGVYLVLPDELLLHDLWIIGKIQVPGVHFFLVRQCVPPCPCGFHFVFCIIKMPSCHSGRWEQPYHQRRARRCSWCRSRS